MRKLLDRLLLIRRGNPMQIDLGVDPRGSIGAIGPEPAVEPIDQLCPLEIDSLPSGNEVRGQAVESLDGPTLPTETSGPWCRVRSWQQLLDQEPHWRYTDPRLRRAGHCLLGRGMNGMIALPSIRPSTYIAVGPVQVYETLTTASGWDAWFTQGAEIDTRQGGRVHLRWAGFGADGYTGEDGGAVLEADYPRRLVFQWKPGDSVTTVAFDLAPRGAGTNVCLKEWAHSDSAGDLAALVECAAACGDRIPRTAMKGNLLCFRQHVPERHPVETCGSEKRRMYDLRCDRALLIGLFIWLISASIYVIPAIVY